MTEEINTSSKTGATPATGSPATGTPASIGAIPTVKPAQTLEEALARIADLERHASNKGEEAARHGKDLTAAQKELAAYKEKERLAQEATLSEIDKATKRTAELEQKLEQEHKQHVNALVKLAAHAKGIIDPDLAALAIADSLEYGDDGLPTNLDKALDDLLKNKPYLKAADPATNATTAAQTASVNRTNPPAIPAMNPGNPGRSQFQVLGTPPQGRRKTLDELL